MAHLVAVSGPLEGQVFPVDQGLTIGRAPHNAIAMPQNRKASRDHCKVWKDGAKSYAVADLGSTNGTLVNDEKVVRAALKEGDRVAVGEVEFRFELDEAEKPKPVAKPAARPDLAAVLEGRAPPRPAGETGSEGGGAASIEIKQRVLQYQKKGRRGTALGWDVDQLAGPLRYVVLLVVLAAAVGVFLLVQTCTEQARSGTVEPSSVEGAGP